MTTFLNSSQQVSTNLVMILGYVFTLLFAVITELSPSALNISFLQIIYHQWWNVQCVRGNGRLVHDG